MKEKEEIMTVSKPRLVGSLPLSFLQCEQIDVSDALFWQTVVELEAFVNFEWLPAMLRRKPLYPWKGILEGGVPSPIIRIDGAPFEGKGNVKSSVYEVEVKPGGIGLLSEMFPCGASLMRSAMEYSCVAMVHLGGPESIRHDDAYFAQKIGMAFLNDDEDHCKHQPVFVRHDTMSKKCSYANDALSFWESISVVPIREDGCKKVLADLGMAFCLEEYLDRNGRELPWDDGFCIKPSVGTWASNVYMHVKNGAYKKRSYRSSQINKFLESNSTKDFLIQPFIPPRTQTVTINERVATYFEIQRLYFAFDYTQRVYRYAGGMTIGTPSLRVHGTPEAYVRKIVIE